MGFEEVFVEISEKRQLPGFGFFRRGGIGAWPGQKTACAEKAPKTSTLEDQQIGDL
jgi:hypothetical protein